MFYNNRWWKQTNKSIVFQCWSNHLILFFLLLLFSSHQSINPNSMSSINLPWFNCHLLLLLLIDFKELSIFSVVFRLKFSLSFSFIWKKIWPTQFEFMVRLYLHSWFIACCCWPMSIFKTNSFGMLISIRQQQTTTTNEF